MNRLKRVFERFYLRFMAKKPHFEKRIEKWKSRGKTTWHERGSDLLESLEKGGQEIKEMFSRSVDQGTIKAKIKIFKKNYKQLNESTKPSIQQWVEALVIAGLVALVLRHFIFGLYHVPTGSAEPTILVGDRVWGNKMAYVFGKVKRNDHVIFDNPEYRYEESNKLVYWWQKYIGLPIPLLGIKAGPINMVKRVIAVPGDVIEGRVEDGKPVIYLNGKLLNQPYVNKHPLIWLKKETGFLPFDFIDNIPLLNFFKKRVVHGGIGVWYTYDTSKSFEDQPYYKMEKSEVIQIPGYPFLRKPYTPSYRDADKTDCADVFGPIRVPEGKYWIMGDSRKNSHDSRWFGFLDKKLVHGRLSFIIYSIDSQEPLWLFELIKHPIDFWTKYLRWDRFFKKPDSGIATRADNG